MRNLFIAFALTVLAAGPSFATDQADVMAAVKQFIDGFNKGDMKMAASACTDQASVIDDFPPHVWSGSGACAKWASDFDAFAKQQGITEGKVTLGKPRHADVTAGHAYVVAPAAFTYKAKGKPVKEKGATFTLALSKGDAGWRITAWTWSKP